MKFRMYGMLVASVGAVALTLVATETFASSRGSSHGAFASTHSRQLAARWFRHHRRSQAGYIWGWGDDDSFNGSNGYGPTGDVPFGGTPPVPGDIHYTQTFDVPWDWAHRFPPAVAPSERPYVSNCPAETVTVPDGHGGKGEINIIRCY